jgi:hypothetical protein
MNTENLWSIYFLLFFLTISYTFIKHKIKNYLYSNYWNTFKKFDEKIQKEFKEKYTYYKSANENHTRTLNHRYQTLKNKISKLYLEYYSLNLRDQNQFHPIFKKYQNELKELILDFNINEHNQFQKKLENEFFTAQQNQETEYIKRKKARDYDEAIQKYGQKIYQYKNKKLTKEDIGFRYERFVGYYLESYGWDIDYHGISKGKRDRGIDLIATRGKFALVVQCKNYANHHEVHENTINQLLGSLEIFKKRHPSFSNVQAYLYTSNNNLDDYAQEAVSLHKITHVVLAYDKNYPLVKCNTNSDTKEKIYHVPGNASYDKIKKCDCYCETPKEAERLGYRAAIN